VIAVQQLVEEKRLGEMPQPNKVVSSPNILDISQLTLFA
jgi:hypothetical protein